MRQLRGEKDDKIKIDRKQDIGEERDSNQGRKNVESRNNKTRETE